MYTYPMPTDKFIPNQRALNNQDAKRIFSGKDSMIFNEDGVLLSTIDNFQGKVNVATTTYQPLGSPIQQSFITGYSITLTIKQCIIEDDQFVQDMFSFFAKGRHSPHWLFQSVIYGYDGSESHYIFRDCVPEGDIDLHNFTIGDIISRNWNLHCNCPPELLRKLTYI